MIEHDNLSKLRQDFDTFYFQRLYPKLLELEESRLKRLRQFCILFFIMCCALPCFIVKMFGNWIYLIVTQGSSEDIESILKLGLLIFAVIVAVVSHPVISYKANVKSSIIDDFINFFGSFRHSTLDRIDDNIIKESLLVGNYNRHYSNDYFSGTYKNTTMVISEEEFVVKGRKSSRTVFKGILIYLNFPKSFDSKTIVFKDWGVFNFIKSATMNLEKVKLEDVLFEKKFEVFSSNQIEARYLLTTAFMERILKVKDCFNGKKIQFSFFDNKLLITIHTTKDMFEPASLFKCSTNRQPINDVLEQFISIFNIVDLLKLTR